MKKYIKWLVIVLIIATIMAVYMHVREYQLKNSMSYADLSKIVKRDVIVFNEKEELPSKMLEKLAKYKVVMTGETHYIKENAEILSKLAVQLHKNHNFKTLLVESPQAFNWIFEDYSRGLISKFSEEQSFKFTLNLFGIDNIRLYNLKQSKTNMINVHAIDINHSKTYFINSLNLMKNYVDSELLSEFINECLITSGSEYEALLNSYKEELSNNENKYIMQMKKNWYVRFYDMLEAEIYSYKCRALLESDKVQQRYYEREEYLKKTVDNYLKNTNNGVMLHMGATHVQNNPLYAPYELEWTGKYLSERSLYAKGNTYSLKIEYAKGTKRDITYNLSDIKMKNNLFKIIVEETKDKAGFLSFDDVVFATKDIAYYSSKKHAPISPKEIWDGLILLPHSTYDQRYKDKYIKK